MAAMRLYLAFVGESKNTEESISITTTTDATVTTFKEAIKRELQIEPEHQQLTFGQWTLGGGPSGQDNHRLLSSYGIREGHFIDITVVLGGGRFLPR
jgi:hypothetical protein